MFDESKQHKRIKYFHKNKLDADRKKNIIAKQAGVNLYRIRENGCPPIDGCTVILLEPNYINNNFESLERAISDLIKKIAKLESELFETKQALEDAKK